MVYRDEGDVEITPYRDDSGRAGLDSDATVPSSIERRSSSSRCKVFMALCFVVALSFGAYSYYEYSKGSSDEENPGSKSLFPKKVGVRGSDQEGGSNDSENSSAWKPGKGNYKNGGINGKQNNWNKVNKGGPGGENNNFWFGEKENNPLKGSENKSGNNMMNWKNKSWTDKYNNWSDEKRDAWEEKFQAWINKKSAGILPSTEVPQPTDECEDDPTFIHTNLLGCDSFAQIINRPMLRDARCAQPTDIEDQDGNEFQVKHFCRKSCGTCSEDGPGGVKNEYVEELEELEENKEEALGIVEEVAEEESQEEKDSDLWEELKEEDTEYDEGAVEDVDPDGDESNIVENETKDIFDKPLPGDTIDFNPSPPDYFVPLTEFQRDAMKEKLREILKETKDALAFSARSSEQEKVDTDGFPWQRTFVLSKENPKQFMLVQHNETGGDTIDVLLRCSLDRQNRLHGGPIKYSEIKELENMEMCMNGLAIRMNATFSFMDNQFYHNDIDGNPKAFDPATKEVNIPDNMGSCMSVGASVMSYSTSLNAVRTFGWLGVDSIAMFANPVERLHRMYQRTARECYECKELKDVLTQIKSAEFSDKDGGMPHGTMYNPHDSCTAEMIGHQATNLLSDLSLYNIANDVSFPNEEAIVNEAVWNLREAITWIGLMERMEESVEGFKEVFPWLADNLNGAAISMEHELIKRGDDINADTSFGLPEGFIDESSCLLRHREVDRYTCGTKDIDEETLKLIEGLNMRDLAVYRAAAERFELQQEVLKEYRESLHLQE